MTDLKLTPRGESHFQQLQDHQNNIDEQVTHIASELYKVRESAAILEHYIADNRIDDAVSRELKRAARHLVSTTRDLQDFTENLPSYS